MSEIDIGFSSLKADNPASKSVHWLQIIIYWNHNAKIDVGISRLGSGRSRSTIGAYGRNQYIIYFTCKRANIQVISVFIKMGSGST
jgi:hypothetical protein